MTHEDYDTRRAAEQLAERNRAAAFGKLAKEIAKELSTLDATPWTFAQGDFENSVRPYGKLTSEGLELDINAFRDGYSANAKERINVTGSWPREKHGPYARLRDFGVIGHNEEEPKITVSAAGTAVRIAKDIKRRLIDASELRVKYAKVLEVLAERASYKNRKAALVAELFAIVGQEPRERDLREDRTPEIRLYEYGGVDGDVQVRSDERVRFELDVRPEAARELLRFLKARKEEADGRAAAEEFAREHIIIVGVPSRPE